MTQQGLQTSVDFQSYRKYSILLVSEMKRAPRVAIEPAPLVTRLNSRLSQEHKQAADAIRETSKTLAPGRVVP
jgi:hypothetical protein